MTITAELMARLLAAAVQFSGLPAIDVADLPPVETVTAAALSAKMCPDRPDGCSSVAALFDTETYRIYLRDTLDLAVPMDNSFLVHELTHVLQQTCGDKPTKGANDGDYLANKYEQEGFQNQSEYIADTRSPDKAEDYIDHVLDYHDVDDKKSKAKGTT